MWFVVNGCYCSKERRRRKNNNIAINNFACKCVDIVACCVRKHRLITWRRRKADISSVFIVARFSHIPSPPPWVGSRDCNLLSGIVRQKRKPIFCGLGRIFLYFFFKKKTCTDRIDQRNIFTYTRLDLPNLKLEGIKLKTKYYKQCFSLHCKAKF